MQTVSYNVGSNAIFPIIPSSPSWQANTSFGCDQPLSYLVQIIANLCAQMMQNEKMNENCRFYQHQKPFFKTFSDMTFLHNYFGHEVPLLLMQNELFYPNFHCWFSFHDLNKILLLMSELYNCSTIFILEHSFANTNFL